MPGETQALIVIDLQNDFCPGGALAVTGGDAIVPRVNALLGAFALRVLTQDWHPANHAGLRTACRARPAPPCTPALMWTAPI